MTALRVALLATFSLHASACSDQASRGVTAARAAIVNGEVSDEADDAVVKLVVLDPSSGGRSLCSGSLVAPNIVLTALHCVGSYSAFGSFSCDAKGVLNTSTPPDGEIGAPVDPGGIEIYLGSLPADVPDAYGKKVFGSGSQVICRNDLAFVVLDRTLEAPVLSMRLARSMMRRESMRVVGYGLTEMTSSTGRHRRAGVLVSDVGTDGTSAGSGSAAPNTFVLGPGACQGDSGGPAISEETGAVTGVYSLSAGISCEYDQVRNIYTQLAPFKALAERTFEFAGQTPLVEVVDSAGAGGESGVAGQPSAGSGFGGATGTGGVLQTGGATGIAGSETTGGRGVDEGSGSRRDSSCTFSVSGLRSSGTAAGAVLAFVAAIAALRRRQRAS
jgi:hypothetical protein